MAESASLQVVVSFSPAPREVREWSLQLPQGATVADALRATGMDFGDAPFGVWGRKCAASQLLRDRDRVEVYRPLVVDPKVARRERFRKQGARAAGLFARRK